VPEHDIHLPFIAFARTLLPGEKAQIVFDRMAERAGIAHRYSSLQAGNIAAGEVDAGGFYVRGSFPGTAARMALYETQAPALALAAVAELNMGVELARITHLIVASCTGFTAPGLDAQVAERLGLNAGVERTIIGFMGCSAAVPALRSARHIVRSDPSARVLVINLELCTLHLQETPDLEQVLSFLLFGDGAAAALVTADPVGIELGDFHAVLIPQSQDMITWRIGNQGFHMHLSGQVPGKIAQALRAEMALPHDAGILRGDVLADTQCWAVHAGGRSVLDAVQATLALDPAALDPSRSVLHDYGNISSATVMFVLQRMLAQKKPAGTKGMAMAFGPGMVAETFRFRIGADS
jgi:predicted naringenin-chalcone synthase